MQPVSLYSAPNEYYLDHIARCEKEFEHIFPVFAPTVKRVFGIDEGVIKNSFLRMVRFHDLGKLTKRWQKMLGTGSRLPSHSTIGAAYLWENLPDGIKESVSFAVAIHHTDRGLLGDNIERPDVQAIIDNIDDNNGDIQWHDNVKGLSPDYFPEEAKHINIAALKTMARGLRIWAKGCGVLEQHQRRLQAFLAHHILKLCDISAASEREDYKKKDGQAYYGGWLMVENIKKYVEAIKTRLGQ